MEKPLGLRVTAVLCAGFSALLAGAVQGGDINYVYDDLGRLKAVIDPATNTAVYHYDAVGNLTAVARQSSAALAVINFTPTAGPTGAGVTIYGTGFHTTPGNNTIKFNGVTAAALTASPTVLTTIVPPGATTGPLTVTVGTTTATSTSPFTVGTGTAPTITSFTPTMGPSGTAVIITGTNYQPIAGDNRVAIGSTYATVSSASSTALTAVVPIGAQSGRVGVATSAGSAYSTQDFFVTPPGVAATDVAYTGKITVGGPQVVASIPTANKVGLLTFDGLAGQRLSVGMTGVTIAQSTLSIYSSTGALLAQSASISTGGAAQDLPPLPISGVYTMVLDPSSTYTGNMTLTLSAELTGTITPGGAAVGLSITRAGQNARYTFNGTAGQTISVGMTGVTIASGGVAIVKPDGTYLVPATAFSEGAINSQVLTTSGTYALWVDPNGVSTGNVTLTLYATPDVSGTIAVDGAPVTATLTVPGQRARYTFAGTAGQIVNLGVGAVTPGSYSVSIVGPSGTTLATQTIGTTGGSVDPPALPTTGTYTVLVDPAQAAIGNMTLTLSSLLTGTITVDGAPVTFTTARLGQNGTYTFTGTSGQFISVGVTGATIPSSLISVLKPDGTLLSLQSVGTAGGSLYPPVLPVSGTYTLRVDPGAAGTGSITVRLFGLAPSSITIDGASATLATAAVGQTTGLTFTGAVGQKLGLGFTNVTLSSCTITLLKPDGTPLSNAGIGSAGGSLYPPMLPVSGTYTIKVDPTGTATGNMTITLSSMATAPIVLDGAAVTMTTTAPGQSKGYTFAGTAGQIVTVGMTGVTLASSNLSLLKPDGTVLSGTVVGTSGGTWDPTPLPVAGTYTIKVDPSAAYTGSMTLTLSSEATGVLTLNAAAAPVTISRVGQNARYTFSAAAGQQVTVRVTGNTLGSIVVYLLNSSGGAITGVGNSVAAFNLTTTTLSTAGTYSITVNPSGQTTGTVNLQVTSP